jgi:hypothetical protein
MTIFVFIFKTDLSKPVKQEVNGTMILPPLVLPGLASLMVKRLLIRPLTPSKKYLVKVKKKVFFFQNEKKKCYEKLRTTHEKF